MKFKYAILVLLCFFDSANSGKLRTSINTHPYFLILGISRNIGAGAFYEIGTKNEFGINMGIASIRNSSGDMAIANPERLGDVEIGSLKYFNLVYLRKQKLIPLTSIGFEGGYNRYSRKWFGDSTELEGLLNNKVYWTIGPKFITRFPIVKGLELFFEGGIKIDPRSYKHTFSTHALYFPNLFLESSIGADYAF